MENASSATRTASSRRDGEHYSILYFGNDWAAENRTSSHHIARRLAKEHRVYYLECPGLRAPSGSGRDLKKIWSKVVRFVRGPQKTPEGVYVWTLLQIPLHRYRFVRWLNRQIILRSVEWLRRSRKLRNPITWFLLPHLAPVVGQLGECLSVYYCTDNYSAMPNVNSEAIKEMDAEMTRKAGVIFVTSDTLLEAKRCINTHTFVSPHGVDLDHFARAWNGTAQLPSDLMNINRPVIGFFGLIEKWIDLGLVGYLAERRPEWSFVMIGRVAVPPEDIPNRSNIHFLGTKPYDLLPDYGARFDVAIIPYKLTHQVMNANPLKLREYLAMGKPVVSVSTPEIDKYADSVRIAKTPEEFLAHLTAQIESPATPSDVARRVERVATEGWDARYQVIERTVYARLSEKLGGNAST